MSTHIYALQLAGGILLCIVSANFFAPGKMRWKSNLRQVESVFRQVFIIHCVFLIGCVFAMAMACLLIPRRLLTEPLGTVILGWMAVFWVARVWVQLFYYEKSIKREFPVYHLIFSASFIYLGVVFSGLTFFSLFV